MVQAVWSATVCADHPVPVIRRLYSDASSGILFALAGKIEIDDIGLPHGVILCPVAKSSGEVTLYPGSRLAGIRFYPATAYGVLGQHYEGMTRLAPTDDHRHALYPLYQRLSDCDNTHRHLELLSNWAEVHLVLRQLVPSALQSALQALAIADSPALPDTSLPRGQRQIERLFRQWLDMTPKQYQRILRVRNAASFLLLHPDARLAEVALQFGFSDQAHMCREFRSLANTTPGRV